MQSRTRILGRFAHGVVRACLSGTVMHVVIVAACSAGGGLQSEPWNEGSAGSGAVSNAGLPSDPGRGPSNPKRAAHGLRKAVCDGRLWLALVCPRAFSPSR